MTDPINPETEMAEDTRTPMERAIAGGYKEEGVRSNDDRAAALIEAMEHAMKHNAPVSLHMLAELRDLLGIDEAGGDPNVGEGA